MKSITLRQIPDSLHLAIKRRAKANHRSLNGEIIAILENAAEDETLRRQPKQYENLIDALLDSPLRGSGLVIERNRDTGWDIEF